MSDAKLRELERRWKETGSVEDEAAILLERIRIGDTPRQAIELAAFCGHSAAKLACNWRLRPLEDASEWILYLTGWGKRVVIVAALEIGELHLERSGLLPPEVGRPMQIVRDWLDGGRDVEECRLAADELGRLLHQPGVSACLEEALLVTQDIARAAAESNHIVAAHHVVRAKVVSKMTSNLSDQEIIARVANTLLVLSLESPGKLGLPAREH